MTPFEDLIQDLGTTFGLPLKVDPHQSCVIAFSDGFTLQIDLDSGADKVLVGSELGPLTPGPYRERIFRQAMRVNGMAHVVRGILAFSDRKDTLILFQFLPLAFLSGSKLHAFIDLFSEHGRIWKEALARGDVPEVQGDAPPSGSGVFGLKP